MKEEFSANNLSEAPIYDGNPFMESMLSEVNTVKKTQFISKGGNKSEVQMIMSGDGDVLGHSVFMRFVEVDDDKFAKLYINKIGELRGLTKQSLNVLFYIMQSLKPNDDRIYFDMDNCMEFCNYKSPKSVFDGLFGLISKGILARSKNHYMYYINPLIIFNGSRVTFATTYRKRKDALVGKEKDGVKLIDIKASE